MTKQENQTKKREYLKEDEIQCDSQDDLQALKEKKIILKTIWSILKRRDYDEILEEYVEDICHDALEFVYSKRKEDKDWWEYAEIVKEITKEKGFINKCLTQKAIVISRPKKIVDGKETRPRQFRRDFSANETIQEDNGVVTNKMEEIADPSTTFEFKRDKDNLEQKKEQRVKQKKELKEAHELYLKKCEEIEEELGLNELSKNERWKIAIKESEDIENPTYTKEEIIWLKKEKEFRTKIKPLHKELKDKILSITGSNKDLHKRANQAFNRAENERYAKEIDIEIGARKHCSELQGAMKERYDDLLMRDISISTTKKLQEYKDNKKAPAKNLRKREYSYEYYDALSKLIYEEDSTD